MSKQDELDDRTKEDIAYKDLAFEQRPDESGLAPSRQLEIATQAWKHFLSAYADKCDTDAVVDEIVSKTAAIVRRSFEMEYPIRYKEEADFIGKLIDQGWIPPEEAKHWASSEEAKCQQRVERIFKEIEGKYMHSVGVSNGDEWSGTTVGKVRWIEIPVEDYDRESRKQIPSDWQALKKKEGIDEPHKDRMGA